LFKFLYKKSLIVNLLLGVGFVALLFFIFTLWLKSHTKHGESITVPNLTGLNIKEAQNKLKRMPFDIVEAEEDYNPSEPFENILQQVPAAGKKVKPGRKIYLTINKDNPRLTEMPKWKDVDFEKFVKSKLEKRFIKVNDISYKPDKKGTEGLTLSIKLVGTDIDIAEKAKIPQSSEVDVVISSGASRRDIGIPSLVGLTLEEAKINLAGNNLLYGAIVPASYKDSLDYVVWRQTPAPDVGVYIKMGESIDLYIEEPALYKKSIQSKPPDTLNERLNIIDTTVN